MSVATMRLLCAVLALALCGPLRAEATAAAVRAEIDQLLARLVSSGCEFQRNGSWHQAAQARSHLLDKLEYLERRRAPESAEQFIEQVASSSSTSGKPYLVRCAGEPAIESRRWLRAELLRLRGTVGSTAGARQ